MNKPKNFISRVKQLMESEGWEVSDIIHEEVHLYCARRNRIKYIRTYGNGHGHVHKAIIEKLKSIESKRGGPVFVAKINGANEIIFVRLKKQEQTILHYRSQHAILG